MFLGVGHDLASQRGGGPASPNCQGLVHACIQYETKKKQILLGDQTRCEANFYAVDHEC